MGGLSRSDLERLEWLIFIVSENIQVPFDMITFRLTGTSKSVATKFVINSNQHHTEIFSLNSIFSFAHVRLQLIFCTD